MFENKQGTILKQSDIETIEALISKRMEAEKKDLREEIKDMVLEKLSGELERMLFTNIGAENLRNDFGKTTSQYYAELAKSLRKI